MQVTGQLTRIATDASAGLTPVMVMNRRVDTALSNLGGEQTTPFSTIHTSPPQSTSAHLRRASRMMIESLRGTHGAGPDRGLTVFGSVRFVPTEDAQAGAQGVLQALQQQGDVGVRAYGPVAFVAAPERVTDRMTIAADDTGATLARVRELDELPTVIAERLRRSNGTGGAPAVADLLKQPHAAATDAVRGWLLSDALAGSEDYIEAQVRRMAPEDLLGAVIDTRPNDDVARCVSIHPGAAPGSGQVDALRAALELHQVPAVIR